MPILLLAASAVEIFVQNFFMGVVTAKLLGIESQVEMKRPNNDAFIIDE